MDTYSAGENIKKGDIIFLSDDGKVYKDSGIKTCLNDKCKQPFRPKRADQEYCSDLCSNRAKRMRNYYKNKYG